MALNRESNSHAASAGVMAVKHSYSISCWDESHSFVIDDVVDTSCLGHVLEESDMEDMLVVSAL